MPVRLPLRITSIASVAASLALSASLLAQEEAAKAQTSPAAATAPAATPTAPGEPEVLQAATPAPEAPPPPSRRSHLRPQQEQPSTPGIVEDEMIPNIQFPNSPVRDVLDFYEKLTGKKVLSDSTVTGSVNIIIKNPVTREEAVRIVETALLLNGFTLVPGPGDIIKALGLSKNARQYAVPILSDLGELPENDQVVSFLFKLEYADPIEVQQAVSQYVAPSPYTSFLPLPRSQALIATESANVIRMLAKVVAALDTPPAEVVSEFLPLERADAKDVVEKLTAMFEKQPNQTGTVAPGAPPPQQGRPNQPGRPGQPAQPGNIGATGTLSEDSLIIGKIKLTADLRTNRIHVVTRPINMPFIRRLVAEYDSDISFGEPSKRTLRFVSAGEVLDIVVRAITEPGMKVEDTGSTSSTTGSRPGTTNTNGSISNNSNGSGSGPQLGGEELSTPEVDTTPESRTVGNTKIIADKRANAIIVLGNQEVKDKIFRVLDQVDVRAPQVMLTAVIGELTLDNTEEFGVDYIQSLGRSTSTTATSGSNGSVTVTRGTRGFAGIARNTGIPITDLGALSSAASLAGAGASGGITGFIGLTDSLEMIVHALESTGRFRITSRPMIFTSNNKKAIIASGQSIPVPGTITSGYTGGIDNGLVNNTSVNYKDVVLKLEVVPLINSEREVTLDIVQEVNSVGNSTLIGGNSIPTINARRIRTTVSVANEATIVLGGLVQETKEDSKTGIPILGKIPVLGKLFSNTKKSVNRTELVVLLRPTVTNGPTEDVINGERVQQKLNFPPDLDATLDPPGTKVNAAVPKERVKMTAPKAQLRSVK